MKYLWILALVGCASFHIPIAVEAHGGLSPISSKVTDAEFALMGAGFDQGLKLVHVPLVPRLVANALAAVSVRSISTFGRTVDSGLLFLSGGMIINITRIIASRSHTP